MSEKPTANEIYTALADSSYGIGRALEIRSFVEQLPELAEYCLDWKVTPQTFLVVRAHLLSVLLRDGGYRRPDELRAILNTLSKWVADPSLAYESAHVSEAEYMLSSAVGLIERLMVAYLRCSLRF